MKAREPRVAIDGPAGAGKSSVSRRVADRLGYLLLDTGALYRCIALAARDEGCTWSDAAAVGELAERIARENRIRFEQMPNGSPRIWLGDRDVSAAIRTQDMGEGASQVSAIPAVRAALLDLQRAAARGGGVVLEGRDIGTVVLPDAEAKFFLTATIEVRAQRRFDELVLRGEMPERAEVLRDVQLRDDRDQNRPIAPLRQAEDAVLVESSAMTIDEVVESIAEGVRAVRARMASEKTP